MALTNIEYGSVASSKVLNDNFNYLEDKIEDYSKNIATNNASLTALINSQTKTIANNLNNEVATLNGAQESLQGNIDTLAGKLMTSIVTQTDNGGSFKLSDPVTGKAIIIQYGSASGFGNGTSKTITLSTPYTSGTSYAVATSATYGQTAGDKGSSHSTHTHTKDSFVIRSEFEQSSGHTVWWIAIGH